MDNDTGEYELGETSIVQIAATTSKSLRATIPQGIVKHFGLREGQTLNWIIKFEGNQKFIVVKPAKTHNRARK